VTLHTPPINVGLSMTFDSLIRVAQMDGWNPYGQDSPHNYTMNTKQTVYVQLVEVLQHVIAHHTDNDTKLLYCAMLRLRMSEHGPSTRSNRLRSILTHLSKPRATTVAALGRSSSSAISPVITYIKQTITFEQNQATSSALLCSLPRMSVFLLIASCVSV